MRVAGIMLKEWHAISQGNITSVIQLHKKEEQLQIKHVRNLLFYPNIIFKPSDDIILYGYHIH